MGYKALINVTGPVKTGHVGTTTVSNSFIIFWVSLQLTMPKKLSAHVSVCYQVGTNQCLCYCCNVKDEGTSQKC